VATVLVVDDHRDTREVIRAVLARAGHAVAVAGDGEEAQRLYAARRADVVITDMVMPGVDGAALIGFLRRGERAPKIIAMSAGWDAWEVDALKDTGTLGADRVLGKPLDLDVLVKIVDDLAAGA
jgi:CheY-like chemotaxis protein